MNAPQRSLRRVEATEVAAYKAAVDFDGLTRSEDVSPLFVMRWLAEPDTRAAIRSAVPPGLLPLQTRQHVRAMAPLQIGRSYGLTVTVTTRPATEPLAVNLAFAVNTEAGEPVIEGEIDFICVKGNRP